MIDYESYCQKRLGSKSNGKISDCQTLKQQLCLRSNRIHLTKGKEDQDIAQECGERKREV
ncbi:hypothetical protein pdam_00013032 [Pocillopora damicornis]|uniref:Uncharacterized protein n=1 Tax=Pocillopora damicornis TaxID=46731 RepID=A0A3M6V0L2_POCDA|nr:hypothetical protein pdam_00013032 [Pocillopora damicornis]